MDIAPAIQAAAKRQNWTVTRVAFEAGVTEAAARRWMNGQAVPTGTALMRLVKRLPGLGELLAETTEVAS